MENLIGLKEFRENVEFFTKKVNAGQTFIVLRKSKPLFKIAPVKEDGWEEVIDFTKIKKGGVKISELLARL
jgi:antitoxin (DNA-binding transcriptional repressor) of toxin-antitoxin stability system